MKKIFYLNTCSTCKRILKELELSEEIELHEIKTSPVSESELNLLAKKAGNFEALFSKKAQLYRSRGLHEKTLSETDFKNLMIEHYTFLKRPILVFEDEIFVGNDKTTISLAKKAISKLNK